MTKKEAYEHIINSAIESKKKLDDTIRGLHTAIENSSSIRYIKLDVKHFENIMIDVIAYKWSKQYPETFLKCHVTGEEYDKLPKAPYTYYMKIINGSLNEFMSLNGLEDFHIHRYGYTDENRLDMYKKRLQTIEELLNNDDIDIIKWCINNVAIN